MATPHNRAANGEIAKTVLMPGDPLRAKWIAEIYLADVQLVSDVRNVYCYTGQYKGVTVSVMASGMGMPSIGIYSYELFKFYDVENIIRVGSAGAYSADLKLFDVVVADSAYSESTYAKEQCGNTSDIQYPSEELNAKIIASAKNLGIETHVGCLHSSDVFYRESKDYLKTVEEKGCLAVEMESFALFSNAKVLGKHAACIVTISDSFVSPEETTPEQREQSFTDMMKIALDAAIA